ncbi:MAG: radical SAM protein [Thermodesulfobacteriota bacterium]
MKVLLITPVGQSKLLGSSFYFRFPFLSLPTVAGLTPPGVDVRIVDEKVDEIPWEARPDLVGITAMTPLAPRAYEIADRFRAAGVPVVLGGMHPSVLPEEALGHADAVVAGEAESVWPRVIEDARQGTLAGVYRAEGFPDLGRCAAAPQRDLLAAEKYMPVTFMETSRGCPHGCHFCSVTRFFGGKHRTLPVDLVVAQLKELKPTEKRFAIKNCVFFVDDNIIGDPDHAAALFEAIRPFNLRWLGQTSIAIAQRPDLLRAMAASGCMGIEIGFETVSDTQESKRIGKPVKDPAEVLEAVQVIHGHGIGIQGSFIFGFDHDAPGVFERTARFVDKARLDAVYVGILTPYPGTRSYRKLVEEGRILHERWEEYDTAHVVFEPKGMTPRELEAGYHRMLRHIYSWRSMGRRLLGSRTQPAFFVPMNLGFKVSLGRMLRELAAEARGRA